MYMLLKPLWIYALVMLSFGSMKTANVGKEKIQWLTLEEAKAKFQENPKPLIIDLYAKWCYWCKVMDKKTYNDQQVIDYINQNFYPVKLDAETKKTIQWRDKSFEFNKEVNVNDFSLYLTNGQLSFPTTVIYTSFSEAPATIPGFMSPEEIEPVLKYFGGQSYRKQTFQDFLKGFKKNW